MHNVESDLWAQQLQQSPWRKRFRQRVFHPCAAAAARHLDAGLSREVDQTWVCSAEDRSRLEELGGIADDVIRNPIPDKSVLAIPITSSRYENPRPIFIGHLAYFPNLNVIETIDRQIVRKMCSLGVPIKPLVAGRSPAKCVRRLHEMGRIELIANPESTFPLLARSGFSTMPLRHGGGTRIKVLEAFAAGVVVIASRVAVEGLNLRDGEHYCQCESPTEMAQQLYELSRNPSRAAILARNARSWVSRHHGQAIIDRGVRVAITKHRRINHATTLKTDPSTQNVA